jgi:hypothetical protein
MLQLVVAQWLQQVLLLVLHLVAGIVFGCSGGREGQEKMRRKLVASSCLGFFRVLLTLEL